MTVGISRCVREGVQPCVSKGIHERGGTYNFNQVNPQLLTLEVLNF